ncbi:recombinase family protein [Paraclostridium sordellii]|uniref:recombinase family protein n=2 Tax=Paraclostridium sordellii TaxID=1505 RepID=UPI0005E526E7|nr:recombinase family protein [Paeniclostridium sordellii]CEN26588.1 Resolvase domain [[Clostridium] sordellii] [Paeniclostridium sordellii]CEP50430.1 Resolvase domain [[Clostridium] sordellii] [Paeniclostridium sordellii]
MNNIYGYARCSTDESRQDIQRQTRELISLGATEGTIYYEYESGTNRDRVEWTKLLNIANEGDTIVTTEVSRLSRSTQHLCEIIEIVKDKKLKLVIGTTMTIDCSKGELDPMTNAFLQMSGVFAELERNMISQRVKSGMANAKSKGKIIGRPTTTVDDIPSIFLKHYPKYKNKQINVSELARLCDMSRTTIYKYIKLVEHQD